MSDDQDFFFDEEETPAEKPERSSKASSAPNRAKSGAAPAAAAATERTVSVTITALVGVVALLAGVIIGVLIPAGGSEVPAPTATNQAAPELSEEELQGGLPSGHPDISGMGGSGAATGSATPTATAP